MQKQGPAAKEEVKIANLAQAMDKIVLVDTNDTTRSGPREEAIRQYLEGLFEDLNLRSDAPSKGIPRVVLTEVSCVFPA